MAKPFSDFETGSSDATFYYNNRAQSSANGPYFAERLPNWVQLRFHRGTIIPEPEEYVLVFGLFALAFVFIRRMMQKKRQSQASITS